MNKKRILSILLCVSIILSLMPMSALAAAYSSWAEATAADATLTEGDTVTIGGTDYIYKISADTTGIEMYTGDASIRITALTENCFWTAGDGYVLYKPTVVGGETTSAEVTLHNAEISTEGTDALALPHNSSFADKYPVPVTVKVEGTNSLTTTSASDSALYHRAGDTTFTGGGTLSITGELLNWEAVIIESGTKVIVGGDAYNQIAGNLTVTGNGSKLTIADGKMLCIGSPGGAPNATVIVKDGAVLENNGTLVMAEKVDKDNSHIVGEISGSGVIELNNIVYTLMGGVFYPYGGNVSTSGLNISGKNADGSANSAYNAPTVTTCYKAGNGYISYTPASTDPAANAKLDLHNAVISTASGRALFLPAEPVDITVTGNNALTANGSYNYAIDPNGQAVSITGEGSLSLAGNKCIASWDDTAPGITMDIGGDLVASTTYSYSFVANGNIDLSAASISTGIVTAGSGSFTAAAKTGNLTIDNGPSTSIAVIADNGITLSATNGEISVTGKGNNLLESSGKITLNAQGDIEMSSSGTTNDAIRFGTGVSITSNAGSINVTTSGYSCMEKISSGTVSSTVSLNTAKDITLNAEYTALSASSQDVTITAGGKLSSTSFYGFQVGALIIKANEVSIAGTQQDGINASSVSITNTNGTSNCKRVSITATSGYNNRAAISAIGNITVKADDLFLCGKESARAIKSNGTVIIGDSGLIVGTVTAGTENIAAGVTRISTSGGEISTSGLNLSTPPTADTIYTAGNGYARFTPAVTGGTPATLALHSAEVSGNITLPEHAVVNTAADSTINGSISLASSGDFDLTFSGTGTLAVNGIINGGSDGTLNVTGVGTTVNVSSSSVYAVIFETVNIRNGASVIAKAEGEDSIGVKALTGGVHISGGSTLTTGCDYGVYIIDGKLEVDSSSKLITNGTVAPFCIVDTTSAKSQSDVVSLSGKPDGTEIKSVKGTTDFSGKNYTYWSLTNGGNLTVSQESSTPVALTGAKTGTLTFVKAASSGGGSGGSGGSNNAANEAEKPSTIKNPFADVSENSYYHDGVLWAVQENITSGTTDNAFSPDTICTRAQIITFLWRAMGSPEPTSGDCAFLDVPQNAYYYKAVLWAMENDITAGTSPTAFSPNGTLNRGQIVTLLWRTAGKPSAASTNPFADASQDAYYYNAMLWSVEEGVTQGTSATNFSSSDPCTRGQSLTFLYRYAGK